MKKVNKDFGAPPSILTNATRMEHLRQSLMDESAHHITNSHYAPTAVKRKLEEIYNNKCAYCESTVKQVASLQVEHFRPKNGVKDEPTHKGYYWLSLEWANLLLGCPACNGQGAKGNHFPIAGVRVFQQSPFDGNGDLIRAILFPQSPPLSDEMPLLLNPEIDEPKDHLKFTSLGNIEGIGDRGEKSIEIYDLNRDSLIEERKKIIDRFLEQCKIISAGKHMGMLTEEGVEMFLTEQLKLLKSHRDNPKEPYTSFVAYLLENPDTCILPRIEPLFHIDFQRAFVRFRAD